MLIEPKAIPKHWAVEDQAKLIEKLWPSIDEANHQGPAHARVEKGLILLTSLDQPMIRAGKGAIQRSATIALYLEKLDNLYTNMDLVLGPARESLMPLGSIVPESIPKMIKQSLDSILSGNPYKEDDNFFLAGMDSLQSLQLIRKLRSSLPLPELGISTVYSNPSLSDLTKAVQSYLQQNASSTKAISSHRKDTMKNVFHEFRERVSQVSTPMKSGQMPPSQITILTWSTGNLGTHLLHAMITDKSISHTYCLKGRRDDYPGFLTRLNGRIDSTLEAERVTFLQADLTKHLLGLNTTTYHRLQLDATLIMHNAWPLNFNLSLTSFHPNLAGLVNLF